MPHARPVAIDGRTLLHAHTRAPVLLGSILRSRSGADYVAMGGELPRHPGSSGRVHVSPDGSEAKTFDLYPHCFDLVWSPPLSREQSSRGRPSQRQAAASNSLNLEP